MKNLPINQRDSWSLLPNIKAPAMASKQDYEDMGSHFQNEKPKNEPQPNAFSANSFPKEEEVIHKEETIKEFNLSYYTVIAISSGLLLIGIILGCMTTLAIYKEDIAMGKQAQDIKDKREEIEWYNKQAQESIKKVNELLPAYDTSIETYGKSIIEKMKPKTQKIVNQ